MKRRFFQVRKIQLGNFYQKVILVGLVIIFLIMLRGVWRLWQKSQMARNNLAVSWEQLEQLLERKVTLESKIDKIKTARGVEEEIRSNFSVVKPGEKVINIIEDEKATQTSTTTPARRWWQIF